MSNDIDVMTVEPQTHKCPNCGKYVIVDAMCFECATAYQKGLRRGRVEELKKDLEFLNLLRISLGLGRKGCPNALTDRINEIEKRLLELK